MPVDLGAVAVAYNAITNGSGPLRLTGPVIARIFLGQITKWDDPAIKALNPGTELPNAYITVVYRSDGSGTTYIFSNYLTEAFRDGDLTGLDPAHDSAAREAHLLVQSKGGPRPWFCISTSSACGQ